MVGWLRGWVVGWLVGWLAGWLVGWLAGCLALGGAISNQNLTLQLGDSTWHILSVSLSLSYLLADAETSAIYFHPGMPSAKVAVVLSVPFLELSYIIGSRKETNELLASP